MNENLSLDQLADYLRMSKSTVYKKTSLRKIPFIKIGKKLLFRKDAIDKWLEEHRHETTEEINEGATCLLKRRNHE